MLVKGVQKFPAGAPRRYLQIAQMIGTKTEKEVVKKVNELGKDSLKMKEATPASAASSESAYEQYLRVNTSGSRKIEVAADERDIADMPAAATESAWTSEQQKVSVCLSFAFIYGCLQNNAKQVVD